MNKLKLDLERLAVESFATDTAPVGAAGTVRGHARTRPGQETCGNTCIAELTCYDSCGETCKCVGTQPEVTCLYECPSSVCTPTCV